MSVNSKISDSGQEKVIYIQGNFDFKLVQEFRQAYEQETKAGLAHIVDMSQVEHMDSSALGMLLNMRKFLGGDAANIKIANCPSSIRKILLISRFDKKFSIS